MGIGDWDWSRMLVGEVFPFSHDAPKGLNVSTTILSMRSLLVLLIVCCWQWMPGEASAYESSSCIGTRFETATSVPLLACDEECQESTAAHPDRTIAWQIVYRVFYEDKVELTDLEKEQHFQCLWDELLRLGASNLGQSGSLKEDITCHASYNQIKSIVQTSGIAGVEVKCTPQDCLSCFGHATRQACLDDGFCTPRYAMRMGRGCIEANVYAGCGSWESCGQALDPQIGLDDACWLFSDGCVPPGFVSDLNLCNEVLFDTADRCPRTAAPTDTPGEPSSLACDIDNDEECKGSDTSGAARATLFGFF